MRMGTFDKEVADRVGYGNKSKAMESTLISRTNQLMADGMGFEEAFEQACLEAGTDEED